jgi:hypothetical protein
VQGISGFTPLPLLALEEMQSVQVLVRGECAMLTALSTKITTLNAPCGIFAQGSCGRVMSLQVSVNPTNKS